MGVTLISSLPELGKIIHKSISYLVVVGVATLNKGIFKGLRDSYGKFRGKRKIGVGQTKTLRTSN